MLVITNQSNGTVLADRATVASGIVERMVGLLARASLGEREALIIPRCNNIHTCGMRFSIDVIFAKTDRSSECGIRNAESCSTPHSSVVVKVVQGLKPFRVVWAKGADTVLELPPHAASRTRTRVGDRLVIVHADPR